MPAEPVMKKPDDDASPAIKQVFALLSRMTEEERAEALAPFCKYCFRWMAVKDRCYCMADD